MSDLWYDDLIEKILDTRADVILVIDEIGAFNHSDFRERVESNYPEIVNFESEIELRKSMRELDRKLVVVFSSETEIPYDFEKQYAILELTSNDVFPNLDKEMIEKQRVDDFQKIYDRYSDSEKRKYAKLNQPETEYLIDEALEQERSTPKTSDEELKEDIEHFLEKQPSKAEHWGKIGQKIGKLFYRVCQNKKNTLEDLLGKELSEKLESGFCNFVLEDYEDLIFDSKSHLNSHVIDLLWNKAGKKKALICLDGMGFSEWEIIEKYLKEKININFNLDYSLSLLPSITSYSRTSLFAGLRPRKIKQKVKSSKLTTHYEEKLFRQKLSDLGFADYNIFFEKAEEPSLVSLEEAKNHENVGIVFYFVDQNVHSAISKQMIRNDLEIYLSKSKLARFIQELLEYGYRVWFSSDHGNVYAEGSGTRISRDLTEENAKRCAIFEKKSLAYEYRGVASEVLQFKNMNGEEYLLLLKDNVKFGRSHGKRGELSHGGISIEEMVLPLVEVKQ